MSAETVAKQLANVRRSGNGRVACCPAHDDKNASLSLTDGTDGKVLAKCHAGCTFGAIAAVLLKRGISLNSKEPRNSRGKLIATYDYKAEDGKLLFQSCRFDPKRFTQRQPDGKGGWQWNLRGVEPVPYRLPELKAAIAAGKRVCIVEGEKDCDNLVKLGFEATTGPMGAGKWSPSLSPHFTGARVVIFPDNDEAGRKHAKLVGIALGGFAAEIVVLELPDLPEKGDVSDWIAAGGTANQLRALIESCVLPWADWLAGQPKHQETEPEIVARLAALSDFEYERVRKAEATALEIRPEFLDKQVVKARGDAAEAAEDDEVENFLTAPEPWPEPIDLADLLDGIVEAAKTHLVLPAGGAEVVALWAVFSHAYDAFHISPYLTATSPTPECGKSTLLTFISCLVPKPAAASNFTSAVIFRIIEAWGPTLLIDEADTYIRDNVEMRGVLNGAHMRSTAYAARVIDAGGDHKPKFFPTWGPKFIALIGKLPVTLASRSIHIEMRRKTAGETVQPLRGDRIDHLTPLCRQAARWWSDNSIKLRAIEPEVPPEIYGRAADNWRPLLAIADAAGGEWPERARQIAIKLGGRRDEQTSGVMLLEDIKCIFDEEQIDRIPSQELVTKLAEMEGRPWVEFRNSKPITPTQLANLLAAFQIVPNNIRIGTKTPKGYKLEQFQDAFARYTGDFAATTPQPSKIADFGQVEAATRSAGVAAKKCEKPSNSTACGGVAASNPPDGQDGRSAPQRCALCGNPDLPGDALGPFGIDHHTWLHHRCWLEWRNRKSNGAAHDGATGGPA